MTLPNCFLDTPLAHRGLHDVKKGRPENSRASIEAAISHGYGVEVDLQLSKDGAAIVFHDYRLDRLAAAKGPIRQRTQQELSNIRLLGNDETIPSFAEVLKLVAGRVPLLVELKDQDGAMGGNIGALEAAAATAVSAYGGPVAFMSFNPESVAALAKLAPNMPRGIVTDPYLPEDWPLLNATTCEHLRKIEDYDRVGASFISHNVADLGAPRVAALKAQGASILCWTVTSTDMERDARLVADNITFEQFLPDPHQK